MSRVPRQSGRLLSHLLSFEVVFALFLFAGVFKASPHLAWVPYDLTATFAVLAGLLAVGLVLTKRVELRSESLLVVALFGLFLAYALFTIRWTPSEIYVREKAFRLASVTAFSLIGCSLIISTNRTRLRRFLAVTLVLALVTAAATLYPFYHHGPVRIKPFGTNYLILGRMIGFGVVVLTTYLLFVVDSPIRSGIAFVLLVPLALALLVLDGRGPLAATALTVLGLFVLATVTTPLLRRPERLLPTAGIATVVGTIVYRLGDSLRVYRKFHATFSDDPDPATTGRLANYEAAYEMWRSGRTLIGHGLASWGPLTDQTAEWPHNVVLELLVELGVIGFVLFSLVVAVGLAVTIGGYLSSREPEYVVVLALFAYAFLNAQVTGDLNDNRFLFAAIGLLCYQAAAARLAVRPIADLWTALGTSGERAESNESVEGRRSRPRDTTSDTEKDQ